jgi:FkbM family methyltransferase
MKKYKIYDDCQIKELEKIYLNHFGYKEDGTFVEIGAYDGQSFSNTCGLADIGWTGVYVEPIKQYYNMCRSRHDHNDKVTVVNKAISSEESRITLYKGGVLSTANKKAYDNFKNISWASGLFSGKTEEVQAITMERLLKEADIKPSFDLLVIDVEGYEWNVLKNFNIGSWKPKMVIIELHDKNPNYECLREECMNIVQYFDQNKYTSIYKDNTNTVYVLNEAVDANSF